MGLIKFSAIVSAASGKIGGNVFARNASGAYARTWVNPVNPNTSKQQATRTKFANLISSWKNLTKAQQQLWQDMTPQYPYTNRLGESSTYTGQQLYNHLNMNLETVGATILTVPLVPETFTNVTLSGFVMDLTAGTLTEGAIETSINGAATESVILEITTSLSGGITKPAKGLFRQVFILADASTSSAMDFTSEYIALYGSPQLATNIFIRAWFINTNTGQRLNLGQESVIVGGT